MDYLSLGRRYYYGLGIERSIEKAVMYLSKARSQGDGSLEFRNLSEKEIFLAKNILTEEAEGDNYWAMNLLSFLYRTGNYLDKDIEKAWYYYEKSTSTMSRLANPNKHWIEIDLMNRCNMIWNAKAALFDEPPFEDSYDTTLWFYDRYALNNDCYSRKGAHLPEIDRVINNRDGYDKDLLLGLGMRCLRGKGMEKSISNALLLLKTSMSKGSAEAAYEL